MVACVLCMFVQHACMNNLFLQFIIVKCRGFKCIVYIYNIK